MKNSGQWHGGKGSSPRSGGKVSNDIANALGCNWCDYYLVIKKKCMKPDEIECPKNAKYL